MSAILNSLNAHNLTIFQPILMILVSKFMVHRALSDKTYFFLGLLSPLIITSEHSVDQDQLASSEASSSGSSLFTREWIFGFILFSK